MGFHEHLDGSFANAVTLVSPENENADLALLGEVDRPDVISRVEDQVPHLVWVRLEESAVLCHGWHLAVADRLLLGALGEERIQDVRGFSNPVDVDQFHAGILVSTPAFASASAQLRGVGFITWKGSPAATALAPALTAAIISSGPEQPPWAITGMLTASLTARMRSRSYPSIVPSRSMEVRRISPAPAPSNISACSCGERGVMQSLSVLPHHVFPQLITLHGLGLSQLGSLTIR